MIVDTPPDFREQVLAYRVPRVDAVLLTHSHADHIFGFDDLRRFNTIQKSVIPAYGSPSTIADMRRIFDYVGPDAPPPGFYRPQIEFREMTEPIRLGNVNIDPLPVMHGKDAVLGFRFQTGGRSFGYVPDCSQMGPETIARLGGVDVMVLDALRYRPHPTHLTVEQSMILLARIGARRSYITHMCHDLDHEETQAALPENVYVSYDGLCLEI